MTSSIREGALNGAVLAVLGAVGVPMAIWVAWRLASRRSAIPCPFWLRWLVETDNPYAKTNSASGILAHLDLAPGMRLLDIGCGPGRVTLPAAEQVGATGEVVAVDIQPKMLRRAEDKARAAGLDNIRFVEAAMGTGTLGGIQADRAVLVTVLGEIPDREAAMREIFDALVPGGVLSVTEIAFDPHFQRRGTVERLGDRVGFQESAFFGNGLSYTLNLLKPRSAGDVDSSSGGRSC